MSGPDGPLLVAARGSVAAASRAYRGRPEAADRCAALAARLDGPLRVAIAGKVKAGKSTLVNALIGDRVAPADAGECTKVVTWYRGAPERRITLELRYGPARALPVRHRGGALALNLAGTPAADVARLVVDWPSPDLGAWTLIDTPGVASLSAEAGSRTLRLLDPADEDADAADGADAVIYLMKHLHAADVGFLETFRGAPRSAAFNAVAVIARADEIGAARPDAMEAAAAVASRYRRDPVLRGLCLDVVAVAGLLAETGRTLGPEEFAAVRTLVALPAVVAEESLRSADRFLAAPVPGLAVAQRSRMLGRFGMFGLRLAAQLVRHGIDGPAALGAEMVRRSGLAELQLCVATRFQDRRDVLKAQSALLGLRRLLQEEPVAGGAELAARVERILTGAHELVELRTLAALRSGAVVLPPPLAAEGLAILGDAGPAVDTRLGLPPESPDALCRARALKVLGRWREHAENPLTSHSVAVTCRTVVRTCEGIVTGPSITRSGARRTR
jgi:hypothetical protein